MEKLPPEMVSKIFTFVNCKQRLICKLVCHSWREILSDEAAFKADRHLQVDHRHLTELHPNVLALQQSSTKFESLTLGPCISIGGNLSALWSHLGETVTELNICGEQNEVGIKDFLAGFCITSICTGHLHQVTPLHNLLMSRGLHGHQ